MARVLVLAGFAPSLVLFRSAFLRELIGRRHEVLACAPPDEKVASTLAGMGVQFHPLGPQRTSLNPLQDARYLLHLFAFMRRHRPTVVIAYTAKPVIWGCLAAALAGVGRRYAMITGLGYAFGDEAKGARKWIGRMAVALYRLSLARCNAVVFQNPDDLREFQGRRILRPNARSFVVNGSGVDLHHYSAQPVPDAAVFLLIARLLVDKGIREYAGAARQLKRRYPSAKFRIIGWFDDNPAAISRKELEAWRDEGTIEFGGAVSDVRPELASASVYVLPSYREGTPRTVLEAMSVGRAIVTTDSPGCRETVRDGWNGWLVPPRDSDALAAAMERFIQAPGLAAEMGARSRQFAEEKYDDRSVARALVDGMGL